MQICLFTPTFYPAVGGAEKAALTIAQHLQDRGHGVTVLAPHPRRRDRANKMPAFSFRLCRYRRPPKQHLFAELLAFALLRAHRRYRFDVVLAFYAYPTGFAANWARRFSGVPVVVSPRGGDLYPSFHGLRKPRGRHLITRGYRDADHAVAMSGWLVERMKHYCGDQHAPTDIVYNGIDLAEHDRQLTQAPNPGIPDIEPGNFALILSRLTRRKRQSVALQAAGQIKDWLIEHNMKLVLAGTGKNEDALRQQSRALGLGQIVVFPGMVTGPAKYWLLKSARLLISPSQEEGMPNTLIEAVASGLPALVSDIGPHVEMVRGKGWGQLFALDDADELAHKMQTMLGGSLAEYQAAAMREREAYALERMIDGYEQALASVVN